jgi:hypothetical protein
MTTRRNLLISGAMLALLASCGPPPETPRYPDIRFTGEPPILLAANQINIVTVYQQTEGERAFTVTPFQALQNWARDRLRANGQGGPARFTITNAAATVTDMPIQGGISGTLTDQVSQRYDIAIDVTLEILDNHGLALRSVHVTAARSQSVLQSATPNDRDKVRYDLVKSVMTDFDRQIEQQIRDNFGLYLISR